MGILFRKGRHARPRRMETDLAEHEAQHARDPDRIPERELTLLPPQEHYGDDDLGDEHVPPVLTAAARGPRHGGEAVIVPLEDGDVIAVVGPGNPADWLPALQGAARSRGTCTGIERLSLPFGLYAMAARPADGDGLLVIVDVALRGRDASHAAAVAVAAARRARWTSRSAAFWPVAILAGWRTLRQGLAAHATAVAAAATSAAGVTAAVVALAPAVVTTVPATRPPAPLVIQHHHPRRRIWITPAPRRKRLRTVPVITPAPALITSSPLSTPGPSPAPSATPTPTPDPETSGAILPTPTPTVCVTLLPLNVCVSA